MIYPEAENPEDFTKELMKNVLSIPTTSGNEYRLRDELAAFFDNFENADYVIDDHGNLIVTKNEESIGENDYFPCFVAHMDTVHHEQNFLVHNNIKLEIKEDFDHNSQHTYWYAVDPIDGEYTGIGGDDKAGITICLRLFLELDIPLKLAFFVSEEVGCRGSHAVEPELLNDVAYFIQFDAPGNNWVSVTSMQVTLYSDEAIEEIQDILDHYAQTNYSRDPFTDIWPLKKRFDCVCFNFFAGYFGMHTPRETVVPSYIDKSFYMTRDIANRMGNTKYGLEPAGESYGFRNGLLGAFGGGKSSKGSSSTLSGKKHNRLDYGYNNDEDDLDYGENPEEPF